MCDDLLLGLDTELSALGTVNAIKLPDRLAMIQEGLRALVDLDPAKGLPVFLSAARSRPFSVHSSGDLRIAESIYEMRRIAIYGLGYTSSKDAAKLLVGPNAMGDRDYRLRATAARSLGVLGFPQAADQILPLLDDSEAEVRWTAAMVLGRLGNKNIVASLESRLADSYAEVRRQAALSLGYLGAHSALPTLKKLASDDTSPSVRSAAAVAAETLSD